jgi:hypothetical protein
MSTENLKKIRNELHNNIINTSEQKKIHVIYFVSQNIKMDIMREVHILEPNWNEHRVEQVIGRTIRNSECDKNQNKKI